VNDLTLKLVICGGGDKSLATSIQPEFWVDRAATAIRFYQAAFGVTVLLQVGEGSRKQWPRVRRRCLR